MTFPRQIDDRFPPQILKKSALVSFLANPKIVHIFANHLDENLNDQNSERISPLPLGINPLEFPRFTNTNQSAPIDSSLLKYNDADYLLPHWKRNISFDEKLYKGNVLRIDRLYDTTKCTTWHDRHIVATFCQNDWSEFCISDYAPKGLLFHEHLSKFAFVLCVHGGGIDPNPKLWQTLMAGSIPIMIHFPGDSMYQDFPIAYIDGDQWTNQSVTRSKLDTWLQELRIYYEDTLLRELVLEKLTSEYWWKKVEEKIKLI